MQGNIGGDIGTFGIMGNMAFPEKVNSKLHIGWAIMWEEYLDNMRDPNGPLDPMTPSRVKCVPTLGIYYHLTTMFGGCNIF